MIIKGRGLTRGLQAPKDLKTRIRIRIKTRIKSQKIKVKLLILTSLHVSA